MMAATSRSFPATEAVARPRPGAWLRVALLAAVPAALAAGAVELTVGRGILDRAVGFEERHAGAVLDAPFTRTQQEAGMLLGNLLYAAGIAAVLAGLLVLGASRRGARERRCAAVLCGAWGLVVVPVVAYPPLPPGVDSGLDIAPRQWLFAACAVLGAGGALAAVRAWRALAGVERRLAAAALLAAPIAVAALLLPDQRVGEAPSAGLLRDFRLVSITSQAAFWLVLGAVGAALLARTGEAPRQDPR
jgi:Probable cobalt transporter subunit (CbtA)